MHSPQLIPLTGGELVSTRGGDWNWSDFLNGLNWSLAAGCFISGHPMLCGGTLAVTGFNYYF